MLKGIDPRLNADVLGVLRAMGHGDTLIIADTNFPADALARETTHGRLLRMENISAADAAEAVMSVFPLDTFVDDWAGHMECPDGAQPVHTEVQAVVAAAEGRPRPLPQIERFAFYDVAREAYAVIQSG